MKRMLLVATLLLVSMQVSARTEFPFGPVEPEPIAPIILSPCEQAWDRVAEARDAALEKLIAQDKGYQNAKRAAKKACKISIKVPPQRRCLSEVENKQALSCNPDTRVICSENLNECGIQECFCAGTTQAQA